MHVTANNTMDSGYDFIDAKIRAARGRAFEGARLDALCRCRNLFELIGILFPRQDFLNYLVLQRALVAWHAREMAGLARFLTPRHASFYRALLWRYAVENVKVALRALEGTGSVMNAADHLVPLPPPLGPSPAELLGMTRRDDLPKLMRDEPLKDAARAGLVAIASGRPFFTLEAALDKAVYETIRARTSCFGGKTRRAMLRLIDAEIALYNTMLLLRARDNFGLPFDAIRDCLVATPDATPGDYASLMHVEDMNELARRVPAPLLRAPAATPIPAAYDMEALFWQRLFAEANRLYYTSPLDPAGLVAYTYIKRVELANLIRVVEGLRYGMGAEELSRTMVRV